MDTTTNHNRSVLARLQSTLIADFVHPLRKDCGVSGAVNYVSENLQNIIHTLGKLRVPKPRGDCGLCRMGVRLILYGKRGSPPESIQLNIFNQVLYRKDTIEDALSCLSKKKRRCL